MINEDMFGGLGKDELESYAKEAEQKWGNTPEFKQSMERVKKMGKLGLIKFAMESASINKGLAKAMKNGESTAGKSVQALIERHYNSLRAFYEPNLELYRGLANMYVADARFRDNYEKITPGLAKFMSEAMLYFVEQNGVVK